MEEVFKCRLHIKKIFNRVWIEFSLSCCLFVYKKRKEPKKILIAAQFHGLDPKKAEAVANSDETKEVQATRNTSDLKAAADR